MTAFLLRLIVGGVLIYAGFSKAVGSPAEFAAAVEAYRLLPAALVTPLATALPWLELLVGTYIVFGYFTQIFSTVAAVLFGTFLGALASALLRGIDLASCGCFGAGVTTSPRLTMALDSALLVIAALLCRLSRTPSPYSADSWINRS